MRPTEVKLQKSRCPFVLKKWKNNSLNEIEIQKLKHTLGLFCQELQRFQTIYIEAIHQFDESSAVNANVMWVDAKENNTFTMDEGNSRHNTHRHVFDNVLWYLSINVPEVIMCQGTQL